MTVQQAFDLAARHHQAGRPAEAEAICRQILTVEPNYAEAWNLLGLVALHIRQPEAAIECLTKATAIMPDNAPMQLNLAEAWRAAGRLEEAIAAYRRASAMQPALAEAHNNLGFVLAARGHSAEAIAAYRRAIQCQPDYATAYANLGRALDDLGKLDEAIELLRRGVELHPTRPEFHYYLAGFLTKAGRSEEALTVLRRAVTLRSDDPEFLFNFGVTLASLGLFDEALAAYREALQLKPHYAEAQGQIGLTFNQQGRREEAVAALQQACTMAPGQALFHYNLGVILRDSGRLDEAVAAYRRALNIEPRFAEAQNNLGNALIELGRAAEAMEAYRQALELKPEHAKAQFNYGAMLLMHGEFARGWPLYEARWKASGVAEPAFAQPRWQGEPLASRPVLLHAEQGFGDSIHFLRYAPLVQARGGKVIIECQRELARLFRSQGEAWEIVAAGEARPPFDTQAPLMSLPLVFQTTGETIPCQVPYLRADSDLAEVWEKQLGMRRGRLRVGLAWMGSPKNRWHRARNITLENLAPVWNVAGVEFFSLQLGRGKEQLRPVPAVADLTSSIQDFADTAALMSQLDLIITVDTAVAHLAGALGRPVWVLLPFIPDWRWGLVGEDTPWYPTMRFFRQVKFGEWTAVVERVATELNAMVDRSMTDYAAPGAGH
jgi:tetratricopeptide (TPR) repeat protein